MCHRLLFLLSTCLSLSLLAGAPSLLSDDRRAQDLQRLISKLAPLHTKLGPPKAGDWLAHHPEKGQSFAQYRRCEPILPRGERRVICIQPLGTFNGDQRRILDLTAEFMGLYFQLPVQVLEAVSLDSVPLRARRKQPSYGSHQILTTWVLRELLPPRLPRDGAAILALTAMDLWPGEGWNFVFGQASLSERVGVWSTYHNGDPAVDFRLCLLRTLKTATHETAHMFSMLHCTAWACNLNGSNSLEESDRLPLDLCPECLAKLCWAAPCDPIPRDRALADFCGRNGLKEEESFYRKRLTRLVQRSKAPR